MKEIININLGTETSPQVAEVRGKDYIEYGTDNWKNLYPQFLIDLYYNSSTNAAIINATSELIAGEDIVIDDEDERNLDAIVKLKQFMAEPNSNETLHELIKKVAFDFKLQGAFALNIVWSRDRTQIAEIYHVPVEKIRCEKPDEMGKVCAYYVSADWSNTRTNKPYRVPAFNSKDRTSANQILYSGLYSPNMNAYYTPDYLAGNNWSLIDQKVSEYHLNNITNGFSGSYFISFANGVPTQEERFQIEQSLTDKFTGSQSAGRFVLTFSEDRNRVPEITPITMDNADKQYLALQELIVQNVLTAHRVTSPMLMGIKNDTGLGSNVDELNAAGNYYLNTVCMPYQNHIIKVLRKLFRVNNMDMPISFVQIKPITLEFTSEDLKAVMEQDEIREELGLPPLNEEVEVREDFSKVGNIDGKPVFDTKEEALAEAEKMGCSGYHEHEYEGKTVYMACEKHEEIQRFSNKTALEQWIEDSGEDAPDGWDLVDEEVVDGEHQHFNYEEELNKIAAEKIELASTGRANPNARSKQDGLNKSDTAFYKVRYVYTKDNFLKQEGETREFCRLMMSAKKVYRKEDIVRLDNIAVNPGWGPRGANTYSIWLADQVDDCCNSLSDNKLELYKGGGNCHHFWLRRIYKAPASDDASVYYKDNITSDELISYTKALSEGFTAKRNDKLVARPPKRMKNEGFLKPR